MNISGIDKKESLVNKVFFVLSCVIIFAFFRFEPEELFFVMECLLIVVRYYMVRELREQRKEAYREAEVQSAKNMKAAALKSAEDLRRELRAQGRKRLEDERKAFEERQRKHRKKEPVATQSDNSVKSNDAHTSSPSTEQVPKRTAQSIPCASDILKAQSVSFSRNNPGSQFGLAEEMSKVGYRTVGDFYLDIEKIVTRQIGIAAVAEKFDAITNHDYLRAVLTRLLYAAALGSKKPEDSDLTPLASALRTIVESQRIVPHAREEISSDEIAKLCSAAVVMAVAACQHGSASALMERLNVATLLFADEKISPDGPSTRRYVTALVLCFLAMVLETSNSVSIVTDSLAGNRLVSLDINQLGSIDFNFLNSTRPGWMAEVIAGSPELRREYLRHLRDVDSD